MAGLSLVLSGCSSLGLDEIKMPHVFGGSEIPDAVLHEPRVVAVPSAQEMENPAWSRLGDVPAKPTNFTPQPIIQDTMRAMEQDREAALLRQQEVENPPPFTPPVGAQ